jgi:hypothetical protein
VPVDEPPEALVPEPVPEPVPDAAAPDDEPDDAPDDELELPGVIGLVPGGVDGVVDDGVVVVVDRPGGVDPVDGGVVVVAELLGVVVCGFVVVGSGGGGVGVFLDD